MELEAGKAALAKVRDDGARLTSVSQDLLAIDDADAASELVREQRNSGRGLSMQDVVTCMEVLKKDIEDDETSVSMLVVGTESGAVLVLEPTGTAVQASLQLPSAPVHMAVTGARLIDYRIVCACRDGNVYTIKNGEISGVVIELDSLPCGIVRLEKLIIVGCMSNTVHAFTLRGKPTYSIYLPAPVSCMDLLQLTKTRAAKGLLIGMPTGEVRLYAEKSLIAQLRIDEPVAAIRFGTYGREESALAIVGASGALTIKMLQRKANLDGSAHPPGPPAEQVLARAPTRTPTPWP